MEKQRELILEICQERDRQDEKWGEQNHHPDIWMNILMEEVGEASNACLGARFANRTYYPYREEMIQIAAVALAALESFERNKW